MCSKQIKGTGSLHWNLTTWTFTCWHQTMSSCKRCKTTGLCWADTEPIGVRCLCSFQYSCEWTRVSKCAVLTFWQVNVPTHTCILAPSLWHCSDGTHAVDFKRKTEEMLGEYLNISRIKEKTIKEGNPKGCLNKQLNHLLVCQLAVIFA